MAVLSLDRQAGLAQQSGEVSGRPKLDLLLRLVQADTTEGLSLDLYLNKQTGDQ